MHRALLSLVLMLTACHREPAATTPATPTPDGTVAEASPLPVEPPAPSG